MTDQIGTGQSDRPAAPAARDERIEAIDILRGLVLFGVLTVNLVTEFRVSLFAQFLPGPDYSSFWDRLVDRLVSTGFETKAFCLFSLLFGVGLAIQFERLRHRPDRGLLLLRRILVLLAFGLIHLFLIWNGDILTEYAVAGLIVLPLLFAPRWVLGAAAAGFLIFYAAIPALNLPIPFPTEPWLIQHVADADATLGRSGFLQVVAFNIAEVPSILPLHLFALSRTLGLFALGAWLWRVGALRSGDRSPFLWTGLVGVLVGLLLTPGGPLGQVREGLQRMHVSGVSDQLAPVVLALGYAGLILFVATGSRSRRLVAWAGPVGRTAFSNYLLQSVVFGALFHGWGLGLFGRLNPAPTFVLGVLVFAIQVIVSGWWLRHFRFGPMEWLWRCLMYARRQPFRLAQPRGGAPV